MFGYGDDEPSPEVGLPRRPPWRRPSLMEEVDDLIGTTSRLTQSSPTQSSPVGRLSPSKQSAAASDQDSGFNIPVIRLVGLVFLCDFLLLTNIFPRKTHVFALALLNWKLPLLLLPSTLPSTLQPHQLYQPTLMISKLGVVISCPGW